MKDAAKNMAKYLVKKKTAGLAIIVISLAVFTAFAGSCVDNTSAVVIKVDSCGLKAEIIATGRSGIPEKVAPNNPQARLLAKQTAMADAYQKLLEAADSIPPEYFPKERYLPGGKLLAGARLVEARYCGDESVETDLELDIALNNSIADRFEKDMRLLGYRVVQYDRPGTEITSNEYRKSAQEP